MTALPPEIFPIVASHLPLYATPPTLLALALTNLEISNIVIPILRSCLILKNEATATAVLNRLLCEQSLGREVRELHVLSGLSPDDHSIPTSSPLDVLRLIERVVQSGSIPFIHTLGITLARGWYRRPNLEPVKGFGRLHGDFWDNLKQNCPRLRELMLRGFEDDFDEPWMEESAFFDVQDATCLVIQLSGGIPSKSFCHAILRHISSSASSLHTLHVGLLHELLPHIFTLNMPRIKSLTLSSLSDLDTDQAMSFFQRHPSLEFLDISAANVETNARWFTSDVPVGFLPNLCYLRTGWVNTCLLAPILGQLVGLAITNSVNAQIPYLLREVIPEGLPRLKSLLIFQDAANLGLKQVVGGHWYETEDGRFRQIQANRNRESRTIFKGYMHSIVRAVPNLEELGLHVYSPLSDYTSIGDHLNGFPHLRRLSYIHREGSEISEMTVEQRERFKNDATALLETVSGLVSITNSAARYPPFLTAKAKRDEEGNLLDVVVREGYGIVTGYSDYAFPYSPRT